jgi:hypothetical protein
MSVRPHQPSRLIFDLVLPASGPGETAWKEALRQVENLKL